jgi:hypothetical protein
LGFLGTTRGGSLGVHRVGGKFEDPARADEVGVGEAAAVGLETVPVELPDLPPPQRVAQVMLGQVPKVVARPDHHLLPRDRRLAHFRLLVSRIGRRDQRQGGRDRSILGDHRRQ